MYKIGDYVKYGGDYSTLDETRRKKGFAKILELKKFDDYWLVGIELISTIEKISCIIDRIRPIETTEKHLLKIGFIENIDASGGKAFILNDIVISSISINVRNENSRSVFISGFCVGDLRSRHNIDFKKYQENDFINIKNFYLDFPDVNNLNHLINYLESEKGMVLDKEQIISL